MFFATSHSDAAVWNDTIQIWRTTIDIQVVFAIDYITVDSIGVSALPAIYNSIFPLDNNQSYTALDIKHWDINRRNKFVRKLFDNYNIFGWFTSFEDNSFNEVCLFDTQTNSKCIKLIGISNCTNKKYYKDSLQRIKFILPKLFYSKTLKELNKHSAFPNDIEETYKRHKQSVNAWIKDLVERGMSKSEAKHEMISLRTRLKI